MVLCASKVCTHKDAKFFKFFKLSIVREMLLIPSLENNYDMSNWVTSKVGRVPKKVILD